MSAQWVLQNYKQDSSISDMISFLNWPSLKSRCTKARLTTFYKLLHGPNTEDTEYQSTSVPTQRSSLQSHPLAYPQPSCSADYIKSLRVCFFLLCHCWLEQCHIGRSNCLSSSCSSPNYFLSNNSVPFFFFFFASPFNSNRSFKVMKAVS